MNERTVKVARWYVAIAMALMGLRACLVSTVPPGQTGVRYSQAGGLNESDLEAGWHLAIPGLHRIWTLPSSFLYLNYAYDKALSIRTKDNNTVTLDVSIPYRIVKGDAWRVMDAGNHLEVGNGSYRFERFANDTAISVLREQLAQLRSADFYNTDRRLEVSAATLKILNEKLAPLHLEASNVLIRAAYFRKEYEKQLAQIQLNEQQKLLDGAKRVVADEQQKLDNYTQQTMALVSAKDQDWNRKIAELDRTYQVGLVVTGEDRTPGAARRVMDTLSEEGRKEMVTRAAQVFSKEAADVEDSHLLGIKNIQAETMEYEGRVQAQADGISARLTAEGAAAVAKVEGAFQSKLNKLLGTPGGRAFVAYRAAANIQFNKTLTFHSQDGIPSVLRLRDFARKFMGQ